MLSINCSGGTKEVLFKTCVEEIRARRSRETLLKFYKPLDNAMKLYVLTYIYIHEYTEEQ